MPDLVRDLISSPQQCWHCTVLPAGAPDRWTLQKISTGTCPQLTPPPRKTMDQTYFSASPLTTYPTQKSNYFFFSSKSILTHSWQLRCWQRGRGTCSVGLKGGPPPVCCQRKAGVEYSSVANSSSFQTKIGLLVGKASPGSMVLEHGFARWTALDI